MSDDDKAIKSVAKNHSKKRRIYAQTTGDLLKYIGLSDPRTSTTDAMRDLHYNDVVIPPPPSRASNGYLFMVRPQLRMVKYNLMRERKMTTLLTEHPKSIGSWIRNTLDPRLGRNLPTVKNSTFSEFLGDSEYERHDCPLVNEKYAFIPIVTNTMKTATGWADKVMGKFVSEPNRFKDTYQQIDSGPNLKEPMTLDVTCHNMVGDPLFHLLDIWTDYSMHVFVGNMDPYWDMCYLNEKDYETRVFRIVLDKSGRYLSRIASVTPGFIEGMSHGAFYDLDKSTPFVEGAEEITFRLSFPGSRYNDPEDIMAFNRITAIFNRDMLDETRRKKMVRVEYGHDFVYNKEEAYPWINLDTLEFEWWVYKGQED